MSVGSSGSTTTARIASCRSSLGRRPRCPSRQSCPEPPADRLSAGSADEDQGEREATVVRAAPLRREQKRQDRPGRLGRAHCRACRWPRAGRSRAPVEPGLGVAAGPPFSVLSRLSLWKQPWTSECDDELRGRRRARALRASSHGHERRSRAAECWPCRRRRRNCRCRAAHARPCRSARDRRRGERMLRADPAPPRSSAAHKADQPARESGQGISGRAEQRPDARGRFAAQELGEPAGRHL